MIPDNTMRTFIVQCTLILMFVNDDIHSLPALNFTNNVLTNQMIEALNEALTAHDRQQLLTSLQTLRQKYQQPSYQQLFADNQQPLSLPSYQQEYPDYFQMQFPGQQQPSPFYQPQLPEQPPAHFYPASFAEQQPQSAPSTSPPQIFYKPQKPEHTQENFYDTSLLQQPTPSLFYQPQPPYQQQFPEQQHLPHPQHVSEPQQPINVHPQNQPAQQTHIPFSQHQPEHQFPANIYHQSVPEQPNQIFYSQHQPEVQPSANVPPQQTHQIVYPSHSPEVQTPISVHPQHAPVLPQTDYSGSNPHQNVNWLNSASSWGSPTFGQREPKTPAHVIHAQPPIPLASGCPTGLCPLGATCSQNSGQWQCACGQNACSGVENPCGIFGRYYFPYYPDASRFIQCDQTGVFWIRRCAPGTVFDPKISVCNYPPVVVETGKK